MKPQILIVEDERVVAKALQIRLTRLGYPVPARVASGEEAVRHVADARPHLVLMDIRLEGKMDGIEAAEQIQTRFAIPVVYMTAHTDPSTLERATRTHPRGYLSKPYTEDELQRVIESALRAAA